MARPSSRVCRVLLTGPLAPFAEAYSAELRARGYTPLTTVNELRQVGRLSRWLEARGLSADELRVERNCLITRENPVARVGLEPTHDGL